MQQYLDLMERIYKTGEEREDRTGVGTWSLFGEQIKFDLSEGFPLLTTKTVYFRAVVVELLWFLRGRTDVQWLQDRNVHIWDEWATAEQCARFDRVEGNLGPIYGHQWRDFGGDFWGSADIVVGMPPPNGVDQITRLVQGLQENPMGRRHIVTAWNPKDADQVALPPCHTLFQCYVHTDARLDLHLYARSIDTFLGLPFNIASYALLIHLLCNSAHYVNLDGLPEILRPGTLTISFGDVHLYKNHREQIEKQLDRKPWSLPRLHLDAVPGLPMARYEEEEIRLVDYQSQGKIPAPVAI